MRKLIIFGVMALMGLTMQAQNIQLHYDFGRSIYSEQLGGPQDDNISRRAKVTLTLEQFKADNLGSWFYFVDVDFSSKFVEGAYAEISREFNLGKQSPFAAHIEYNGGLNRFGSFHFSVGTEVEISNNFIYNVVDDKSFFINPTLAVKWNF